MCRPILSALLVLAGAAGSAQAPPSGVFYFGLTAGGCSMRVLDQDTGVKHGVQETTASLVFGAWCDPSTAIEMQVRFLGNVDVGTTYDGFGNLVRASREVSDLSFGLVRLSRKAALYGRADLVLWSASGRRDGWDDGYYGSYDPDRRTGVALGLEAGLQVKVAPRWRLRAGAGFTSTILDSSTTQWQAGFIYTF